MLGKNSGTSSRTWQFQEKIQRKPLRCWRIVLLTHCSLVYNRLTTGDVLT